jgi:hypothetical protein
VTQRIKPLEDLREVPGKNINDYLCLFVKNIPSEAHRADHFDFQFLCHSYAQLNLRQRS